MKTYQGHLKPAMFKGKNNIFVFGSNTQGRHGKGSAKFALDHCKAIYGKSQGLQGYSYAIVTKDLTKKVHPSISKEYIMEQIDKMYLDCELFEGYNFYVAYRADVENLNAYSPMEMAEMFHNAHSFKKHYIPDNVYFEESFAELIYSLRIPSLF